MQYSLQDYHNYAKYIPFFFKLQTYGSAYSYETHEVGDPSYITRHAIPENAVAMLQVWTKSFVLEHGRDMSRVDFCFMDSSGHRIKDPDTPIEFAERVDEWLVDVRARKEEFEAFMEGAALRYHPMTLSEMHQMARPE